MSGKEGRANHRYRWIVLTVLICVAAVGGAFAAGTMVRSGNDKAAANSRTVPTVTAMVEERTITPAPFEATGKLSLGTAWDATVPTTGSVDPIVTATYLAAGSALTSGGLIANVAGRPVIALTMPFALYRDIHGGDTGDDVAALQRALTDLGLYASEVDGVYGAGTARAVGLLYERVGAEPPSVASSTAVGGEPAAETPAGSAPSAAPSISAQDQRARELAALTPLPRSEIVSLSVPSASVVSIAEVGSLIATDNPLVKLRGGEPTVTIRVGMADLGRFPSGQEVEIRATTSTENTAGRVATVSAFKGADGSGSSPGYDVTIDVPAPGSLQDGADVVVQAQASEPGTSGLAVPVMALREESGRTYVLTPGEEAQQQEAERRVPVIVNLVSDGFAILADGDLAVGDIVIIAVGP